jgi:hypothetical protein
MVVLESSNLEGVVAMLFRAQSGDLAPTLSMPDLLSL